MNERDLELGRKSLGEEKKAVSDYTDRLNVEENPILRKATEHALEEEKTHAKLFSSAIEKKANRYLEKIAAWSSDPNVATIEV